MTHIGCGRYRSVFALCGLLLLSAFFAEALAAPEAVDENTVRYLGVVTCAGSTCHGAPSPSADSRVLQNEFITWHRQDKHAKAYQVLLEPRSERIARNLGLDKASAAPLCLSCHATNAPVAQRGKRFNIADGVTCESCHGPASRWLGVHVTGEASRSDNLALGMYPTEEPRARATLCLSCHLGTSDNFATHRLLGAGHPRIGFELDTFTRIQPAHYRADNDYRERKQVASSMQVWASGQLAAASRLLELFASDKFAGSGPFPELAFFDCHACHHPFTKPRWEARADVPGGGQPGVPRINDGNLLMVLALARHTEPALATRLEAGIRQLHEAGTTSREATREAVASLVSLLGDADAALAKRSFASADMQAVLRDIVAAGARGAYRDYLAAEQAVMAIGALLDALHEAGVFDDARMSTFNERMQALYAVTADQNLYEPGRLGTELESLKSALD